MSNNVYKHEHRGIHIGLMAMSALAPDGAARFFQPKFFPPVLM